MGEELRSNEERSPIGMKRLLKQAHIARNAAGGHPARPSFDGGLTVAPYHASKAFPS